MFEEPGRERADPVQRDRRGDPGEGDPDDFFPDPEVVPRDPFPGLNAGIYTG